MDQAHERVPQLEGVALDRGQRLHVLGDRDHGALALGLVPPARRGQLERLRDHRGQAHRPEGDLGLTGNELLQLANRRRGLESHVADHHQPPAGRLRLVLAQHELGVGEDRGEGVVEVVRETAHRLAEGPQVLAPGEPPRRLGEAAPQIARPAAHREHRAVHLHLGAADLARDVLDLLVIGEEQGFRRYLTGVTPDPAADALPDPLDHGRSGGYRFTS